MRSRILIFAIFALVLSVMASFFAYRLMQPKMEEVEDISQIVVAARKLSLGARLTRGDLKLVPWPRNIPFEGSFLTPEEIVGRGVIVSMIPNEPVLQSKLAPEGSGAGLTSAIPSGQRAVAVKVNDVIGVAGFVLPGTRVDVILVGGDSDAQTSKIILENVQVLAAGQNLQQEINGKPEKVQVITLLLTPEEAPKLALASVDGRIQLALRNPLDLKHTNPSPVRISDIYGTASKKRNRRPARARRPVSIQPVRRVEPARAKDPPKVTASESSLAVELIQGEKREMHTFKEQ